ncbi:FMN-dependent oxidoreductase (nitrilotriacetate monooxygenase family) [Aurantimicrobium minutum]|uniref:LLM class flavin-dependent oxidoreductase n=1 Tax=Aurantimicrobium minutum TaxID=708131 RepID=UPI002404EC2F|nr:LLM class flavin-dependent oxidoreductase [Aurantimicrobium minutum]MDF9809214.1 FMN-dependent oxidoreductase (nitrilotriacetate monooxygenase family) [Aurantimicrobium minutum]
MAKQIRFNAFDMSCVGHVTGGTWRHPDNKADRYNTIEYWTELAKLLEQGVFDGIFIADVLGTYDVFGGNHDAAIKHAAQVPVTDPLMVVSAMASVTKNLGFGVTAGTSYEHPYPFARRLSTLDHLTQGRIGWNVVTGYLPSAARNMGHEDQLEHDARYDHADEYLEVLYKLWESSWEDDAVIRDRESGVFTDPSKVHDINHKGKYFSVPGIHLVEPSPQRTPVIYQAGASKRGIGFAAENAEAIFVAGPTKEIVAKQVSDIHLALEESGRGRNSARIYAMLTIIVDESHEKAVAKHEEYLKYASPEAALVLMSGWMGVDLSEFDLSEPLGNIKSNAIQSIAAAQQTGDKTAEDWTVGDIAEYSKIRGFGAVIVGDPSEIADQLEEWAEVTGADGFNLAYAVTPGTFEDIVKFVVPELQRRGVYPTEYQEGTLRQKLFNKGDHLAKEHRGYQYKVNKREGE